MGSGVGSGSMMAAASGAIAAQQTPEMAKSVLTFAAASNLITTTIGTYFTLFISLPMAVWGYRLLEPLIGRTTKASSASDVINDARPKLGDVQTEAPELGYRGKMLAWGVTAVMALVCDWITHGTTPLEGLPGMLLMVLADRRRCGFQGERTQDSGGVLGVAGGDVHDVAVVSVGRADCGVQLEERLPRRDDSDAYFRGTFHREGYSGHPATRLENRACFVRRQCGDVSWGGAGGAVF